MLLAGHGLESIDPERWYDLELACSIYASVGRQIGTQSLEQIGIQLLSTAEFPADIVDVHSALAAVVPAYEMNVRGDSVGTLSHARTAERCATFEFATPFPCGLEQGLLLGCCARYGQLGRIEHLSPSCRAQGAEACQLRVSW